MIERFEQLLKSRIGLDAESVGRLVIERAVRQRIIALGCADEETYWTRLSASPSEQQALVEAVVVPETWFFRYPESFVALKTLAFERLPALAAGRTLRFLSLPCSTGEEPYSIAMALLDAGLAPSLFQIDAIDISEQNLERARAALYGRNSFRGDDLGFRQRHFVAAEGGYALAEAVRRKVRFLAGNLLDPALLAGEAPYDFVFCRNLLIYFDRPTQASVLQVLRRLMRADGEMFIGPAEASLLSQHGMQALGIPAAFVFRNPPAGASRPPRVVPAPLPAKAPPPVSRPAPSATPRPRAVLPRAPASAAATRAGDDEAAASLLEIASLANAGRSEDARQAGERHLQRHGPSAPLFYWLGLIADGAGRSEDARDYYRKVLYLDPQHAEALAHLGALLAAVGDHAGARRLQQRASRGVTRDDR